MGPRTSCAKITSISLPRPQGPTERVTVMSLNPNAMRLYLADDLTLKVARNRIIRVELKGTSIAIAVGINCNCLLNDNYCAEISVSVEVPPDVLELIGVISHEL